MKQKEYFEDKVKKIRLEIEKMLESYSDDDKDYIIENKVEPKKPYSIEHACFDYSDLLKSSKECNYLYYNVCKESIELDSTTVMCLKNTDYLKIESLISKYEREYGEEYGYELDKYETTLLEMLKFVTGKCFKKYANNKISRSERFTVYLDIDLSHSSHIIETCNKDSISLISIKDSDFKHTTIDIDIIDFKKLVNVLNLYNELDCKINVNSKEFEELYKMNYEV